MSEELNTTDRSAWLRCYRCWSQRLEAQVHYDAILRIDPETGEPAERIDEVQESVVQCLDCMHDQPHLSFDDGKIVPIEDRWERMVAGTPWVASCTVTVDQDLVEACSGPEAADSLTYGAFGDAGTREFFTHVRFHKHDEERIVVHLLVELYARSPKRRPRSSRAPPAARSRSPPWPRRAAPRRTPPTRPTEGHRRAIPPAHAGPSPMGVGSCRNPRRWGGRWFGQ